MWYNINLQRQPIQHREVSIMYMYNDFRWRQFYVAVFLLWLIHIPLSGLVSVCIWYFVSFV